jgi:hypothetical protein
VTLLVRHNERNDLSEPRHICSTMCKYWQNTCFIVGTTYSEIIIMNRWWFYNVETNAHSWPIALVPRQTRRVPQMEHKQLIPPEHPSLSLFYFVGFWFLCSALLIIVVPLSFSPRFCHCIVCYSIYGFLLPRCYLQTFPLFSFLISN